MLSFISALVFSLSVQAAVASPETTLDLAKFAAEGRQVLAQAFGAGSIVPRSEGILFQDGAGGMDLNPAFDYASVNYGVALKPGTVPGNYNLAIYRLNVAGGLVSVWLGQFDQPSRTFRYAAANELISVLKPTTKPADIKRLENKLKQIDPQAHIQVLDQIGVLRVHCAPKSLLAIAVAIRDSGLTSSTELSHEVYRIPFQFEAARPLQMSGKVDTENLRTLTKEMKNQGIKFTLPSVVPARLR